MSEFNEDNPKFIAYVNMLGELTEKGLLKRNPDNKDHVLIYYTNLPADFIPDFPEITEGWFSRNIFDVAEELFHNKEDRDSLLEVLREDGVEPIFTSSGDFDYLKGVKTEREIE